MPDELLWCSWPSRPLPHTRTNEPPLCRLAEAEFKDHVISFVAATIELSASIGAWLPSCEARAQSLINTRYPFTAGEPGGSCEVTASLSPRDLKWGRLTLYMHFWNGYSTFLVPLHLSFHDKELVKLKHLMVGWLRVSHRVEEIIENTEGPGTAGLGDCVPWMRLWNTQSLNMYTKPTTRRNEKKKRCGSVKEESLDLEDAVLRLFSFFFLTDVLIWSEHRAQDSKIYTTN